MAPKNGKCNFPTLQATPFLLSPDTQQADKQWIHRETIKIRKVRAIFQVVWQILILEKLENDKFNL